MFVEFEERAFFIEVQVAHPFNPHALNSIQADSR